MVLSQNARTSQHTRSTRIKAQTERFFLHCQQARLCQFKSSPFRVLPQYPTWKHLGTLGFHMFQLHWQGGTHLFQLMDTGIPTPQKQPYRKYTSTFKYIHLMSTARLYIPNRKKNMSNCPTIDVFVVRSLLSMFPLNITNTQVDWQFFYISPI